MHSIKYRFCFSFVLPYISAINTVTLLGRVGNNPQMRGNENTPVVTFSMATHASYK